MSQTEIAALHDAQKKYFSWLKDKTTISKADGEWLMVTTPFLDRHNDCIQLCLKKESGGWLITDDGQAFESLGATLFAWESCSPTINSLLRGLGVGVRQRGVDVALETVAVADDFPERFQALLQAVIVISNLG